ncbi:hypothetical protein ACFVJH_12335 [Streptomyces decoyicus]|uniref:hypothetical protein n=1 Tax=Streptomyces decoyicus TaxID=249567 RepID=UPI00362AE569
MAADLAAALWQLAVFYHRRGLGETSDVWLDGQSLAVFCRTGRPDLSPATRKAIASRVRSLAHPVPISGRDVHAPYTPAELAALWQAAGDQNTPERCRDARILLALGAGAGLTAAEIAQVRAHDVRPAGAAVVVAARGRTQRRMVIVRRAFEHTLAQAPTPTPVRWSTCSPASHAPASSTRSPAVCGSRTAAPAPSPDACAPAGSRNWPNPGSR